MIVRKKHASNASEHETERLGQAARGAVTALAMPRARSGGLSLSVRAGLFRNEDTGEIAPAFLVYPMT